MQQWLKNEKCTWNHMNFLFLCTTGPFIPKADLTSEMREVPIKNRFLGPASRNSNSVILGWGPGICIFNKYRVFWLNELI